MPHFQQAYGTIDPSSASGFALSSRRQSVVVALLSAGCFAGALLGVPTADFLGRRGAIFMVSVIFIVGVIVQIAPTGNLGAFIGGRFVAGLGVGVSSDDCFRPGTRSPVSFIRPFLHSYPFIREKVGYMIPRIWLVLNPTAANSFPKSSPGSLRIMLPSHDHLRDSHRLHSRLRL